MTTQPTTTTGSATVYRAIHWGFIALFGSGAAVHFVLALTTPQSYRPFADDALFDWVYDGWQNIYMAHPTLWALLLAVAELTIAVLLVKVPARRLRGGHRLPSGPDVLRLGLLVLVRSSPVLRGPGSPPRLPNQRVALIALR